MIIRLMKMMNWKRERKENNKKFRTYDVVKGNIFLKSL